MANLENVNFNNKVVVITGGAGIICSCIAKAYALKGAKVALLGRNAEALDAVANEIISEGGIAKGFVANVLEKESLEKAHEDILNEFGPCDILVNGAGGNNPKATTDNEYHEFDLNEETKSFFDLDIKSVEMVFDLNFIGTLLPCQVFAKDMFNKEGCSILNISSMNAYRPLTKIPAYSGAKAGINNFTSWLAVHFSHLGIRVNAIAPGFFSTTQNKKLLWNEDGTPTLRTKKILNATPLNRFGEVDELVGASLFLTDANWSGFITGITLPIDGGFLSYSNV